METFIVILFVVLCSGIVASAWGLHCNERTLKERQAMIESWPHGDHARFNEMHCAYSEVDYDQHMWALFCFRDPKKLYRPEAFAKRAVAKPVPSSTSVAK